MMKSESSNLTANPTANANPKARRRKLLAQLRPSVLLGNGAWLAALLFFAAFFAIPLVWILLAPSKTNEQLIFGSPLSIGTLEQFKHTWQNLTSFNDGQIFRWALNSLIYMVTGVGLSVSLAILAGYGLTIQDFPLRRLILILTLIALILPGALTVLPLFLMLSSIGLTNTMIGVILVSGFFPFGVYLAFIYFSTVIPRALLDAARVDGCNEWQTFWYIARPLALPVVSLIAFFSFVGNWNNYFGPYVLLSDDRLYNLPVGLGVLFSGTQALNPGNVGGLVQIQRPEVALAGLFIIVPIMVVFVFSQRFVQSGLTTGAEKS